MENSEKLTWDYNECAKQIGVSVRTLSRYVNDNKIPVVKFGKRVLFRPSAVMEWLSKTEEKPT